MAIEKYQEDKQKFLDEFANFRADLFFPEAWNADEKAKAAEIVRPSRVKTGMLSAIPMTCRGNRCVYAEICPLLEQNLAPEGKKCPIELTMVKTFFDAYVEELDVDVTQMVEVSMVRDLVDQEIQQNRATWLLSLEHFIQENAVGIDAQGRPVLKKELHQAVEFRDKIFRNKEKLRSALLATREARAKAGQGQLDTAQVMANLMNQVKKFERTKEKTLLARLGFDDSDAEDAEIVDEE